MSIYTPTELAAEIAATKEAIGRALQAVDYTHGDRRVTRERLAELRAHLAWLERQRAELCGAGGPVILPGRPAR